MCIATVHWPLHAHLVDVNPRERKVPFADVSAPPVARSGQLAARQQLCPQVEAAGVIHPEHIDSRSPNGCQPFDARTP
jgi:hypothetical protein